MFKKILIANRGEIAVRIARTCHELGIEVVAVYSDADRRALHVLVADQAMYIGRSPAPESYLNIEAIVRAAVDSDAEAVHPGYGLLSENPEFAEASVQAGLVFIGPPAEAIRTMGDKATARRLAASCGVATVPGYDGGDQAVEALLAHAKEIGFPVMIKAVAGGGGRGMRLVETPDDFEEAAEGAQREAERSFGDGRLMLERAVMGGRHVEIQVLADSHGGVVHLGERDCSVQRRHQKVIEETPSPAVDAALRRRMGEAAITIALKVGYQSAGTLEFLLDASGEFYFLEMNTRLQVEHGVTEMVTGLDIVALQLGIAAGERLPFGQEEIAFSGHAIESRVYAEDPLKGFLPSPGRITMLDLPSGEGIRNDTGTYPGDEISTYYDPMLAKVLVWGRDRDEALRRMERALAAYRIGGVHTNLSLLQAIFDHPTFRAGQATTDFLEAELGAEALNQKPPEATMLAAFGALTCGLGGDDPWYAAGPLRAGGIARMDIQSNDGVNILEGSRVAGSRNEWSILLSGSDHRVRFDIAAPDRIGVESDGRSESFRAIRTVSGIEITLASGRRHSFEWALSQGHGARVDGQRQREIAAPMPGLVLKVLVRPGEKVRAHQTLVVLEAMKMEHAIDAPHDGVVKSVNCAEGGRVAEGVVLIELEAEAAK